MSTLICKSLFSEMYNTRAFPQYFFLRSVMKLPMQYFDLVLKY